MPVPARRLLFRVGINAYPFTSESLREAHRDARDVERLLRPLGFEVIPGLDSDCISAEQFSGAVDKLSSMMADCPVNQRLEVIVYVAAHAMLRGQKHCVLCSDFQDRREGIAAGYIVSSELVDSLINALPEYGPGGDMSARHLLFVFDVCRGGDTMKTAEWCSSVRGVNASCKRVTVISAVHDNSLTRDANSFTQARLVRWLLALSPSRAVGQQLLASAVAEQGKRSVGGGESSTSGLDDDHHHDNHSHHHKHHVRRAVLYGVFDSLFRVEPAQLRSLTKAFEARLVRRASEFVGRTWLDKEVQHWRCDMPESRWCVVSGRPGVGKSSWVAHAVIGAPDYVLAYHLTWFSEPQWCAPERVVQNLCAQIMHNMRFALPSLELPTSVMALSFGSSTVTPHEALEQMFLALPTTNPLGDETCLVVIDAVNEAIDSTPDGSFIEMLSAFAAMPRWIKLLVTTQSGHGEVTRMRDQVRIEPYHIEMEHRRYAADNEADVAAYIRGRLPKLRGFFVPGLKVDSAVRRLCDLSGGHMMYVHHVLSESNLREWSTMNSEDGQPELLTLDSLDNFPPGLSSFFSAYLHRRFAGRRFRLVANLSDSEEGREFVRRFQQHNLPVLACIAVSLRPLPINLLVLALQMVSPTPQTAAEDVEYTIRQLGHLLTVDEHQHVRITHLSFMRWLTDPDQSHYLWHVDTKAGDRLLADLGLVLFRTEGRDMDCYFWHTLVRHMVQVGDVAQAQSLVLDYTWLVGMLAHPHNHIHHLLADIRRTNQHGDNPHLRSLHRIIRMCRDILMEDRGYTSLAYQLLLFRDYLPPSLTDEAARHAPRPTIKRRLTRGLKSEFTRHRGPVRSLCAIPETDLVASGGSAAVRIWSWQTGQPLRFLYGHHKIITRILMLRSRDWLVSASADATVKLWNWRQGNMICVLRHPSAVDHLAVSHGDTHLIAGLRDGSVWVWHLESVLANGDPALPFKIMHFAKAAVRCLAAVGMLNNHAHLVCGGNDEIVRLLNVTDDSVVPCKHTDGSHWFPRLLAAPTAAVHLPDPQDEFVVVATLYPSITFFNWRSGEAVRVISGDPGSGIVPYDAVVSADQASLLVAMTNTIRRIPTDPRHADQPSQLADAVSLGLGKHRLNITVWCLAVPDSEHLLSGTNSASVQLWRPSEMYVLPKRKTLTMRLAEPAPPDHLLAHRDGIQCITSLDSHFVVTGSLDGSAVVWEHGKPIERYTVKGDTSGPAQPVLHTTSSPSQRLFVAVSQRQFNRHVFPKPRAILAAIKLAPAGDHIVPIPASYAGMLMRIAFLSEHEIVCAFSDGWLHLWNRGRWDPLLAVQAHAASIRGLQVAQDRDHKTPVVLSAGEDGTLARWCLGTGEVTAAGSFDCSTFATLPCHSSVGMLLMRDGEHVVVPGGDDKIYVYSWIGGHLLHVLQAGCGRGSILDMCQVPNYSALFVSCGSDRNVRVWNWQRPSEPLVVSMWHEASVVKCVCATTDCLWIGTDHRSNPLVRLKWPERHVMLEWNARTRHRSSMSRESSRNSSPVRQLHSLRAFNTFTVTQLGKMSDRTIRIEEAVYDVDAIWQHLAPPCRAAIEALAIASGRTSRDSSASRSSGSGDDQVGGSRTIGRDVTEAFTSVHGDVLAAPVKAEDDDPSEAVKRERLSQLLRDAFRGIIEFG